MTVQVRVEPRGRVLGAATGDDLRDVLQSNDEPIATACGGVATCGLCVVSIRAGSEWLGPVRAREREHLREDAIARGDRLACQAVVRAGETGGEIVVFVPPPENRAPP